MHLIDEQIDALEDLHVPYRKGIEKKSQKKNERAGLCSINLLCVESLFAPSTPTSVDGRTLSVDRIHLHRTFQLRLITSGRHQ